MPALCSDHYGEDLHLDAVLCHVLQEDAPQSGMLDQVTYCGLF